MEAKKSALRSRKPLSDCTNKVVSAASPGRLTPSISSFIKSRKSSVSSDVQLLTGDGVNGVACFSNGTPRTYCSENPRVPCPNKFPLATSSTPVLLKQPSGSGVEDSNLDPPSFYSRRQTVSKRKHKEAKNDLSSFSYTASKFQGYKSTLKEHGYDDRRKACTVPHKKKRNACKNALPQDFIDRQRAYFAEIDAFELSEEEVESVLELD